MTDNIKMIKRSDLMPHPDNPRKDLGDLEELKESIRAHGIMQNLTVVPEGNKYKILIGHRRYAASEGILDELPCVVCYDLTYAKQVGIMLAENMQRSDLTFIEQAHGFQLMLDLGDTVETISQKTGFSKATVKHRLAINELDPKAIEEAKKWFQPTIADFMDSYWRVNEHILEGHQAFMNVLKDMGFQIKDEWKPVLDGTSDLYKKEDD